HGLQLRRRYRPGIGFNHLLGAIDDIDVPLLVVIAHIATVVPASAKHARRLSLRPPVATHNLWPPNADLADRARPQRALTRLEIYPLLLGVADWRAARGQLNELRLDWAMVRKR